MGIPRGLRDFVFSTAPSRPPFFLLPAHRVIFFAFAREMTPILGDPLWEWAASVSWPWPPWVLLPELEPGLESPPKPPPYRDSESKRPSSHSHTVTLLLAGAYCRACAFTWKYRLSCRTTQSLPMTRPVSR